MFTWFKASFAEILLAGSNWIIYAKRSKPLLSKLVAYLLKFYGYHFGNVDLKSGNYETPGLIIFKKY